MKLYIAFWLALTINTVIEIVLNAYAKRLETNLKSNLENLESSLETGQVNLLKTGCGWTLPLLPEIPDETIEDVKQMVRFYIAMISLTLVQNTNAILLNLVILAYYWKAGDKLSKELASNMTRAITR